MAKKEYCPTCGQPIMRHHHSFSQILATMLLITATKYDIGKPFHLQKNLGLTNNQYNNFQKLKYWGLIAKHFVDGKRIGGYWVLTKKAQLLIRGIIKIPKWVATFNNKPVEQSTEEINIKNALGFYQIPEQWAETQEQMSIGQQDLLFMNPKL